MNQEIKIGKKKIGPGNPVFIVAEMSGNHQHSLKRAMEIIDAAALAGADAIKLQTYTPDTMTINCDNEWFRIKAGNAWAGQNLYELYRSAHTPWEWQAKLKKYAEKKGLICFSTPFDETAVDFLEKLKVKLHKVASFEVPDLELLKRIGRTKKPVIISRGLASVAEIRLAVDTLKKYGTPQMAILHCVSSYPATVDQMNLVTIPDLARRFKTIVGLSDHSLGVVASVSAVSLGASIIEKHLTLRRADGGPDSEFSLEPREFKELVETIRETEKAIGKVTYTRDRKEEQNLIFRRSLFVVADINEGDKFTKNNVRCIRPGYGLAPRYLSQVIGKKAVRNISRGTPLSWKLIKK